MMEREFWLAPEAAKIADPIIAQHHKHLIGIPIEYWFCSKPMKSKGKVVWAQVKKMTGLAGQMIASEREYELNEFFVVQINSEIWTFIDANQRAALIDHELCHAWAEENEEGEMVLSTLPHDIEEFACIIDRHGLWADDVKVFAKAVNRAQLAFPVEEEAAPRSRSLSVAAGGGQ